MDIQYNIKTKAKSRTLSLFTKNTQIQILSKIWAMSRIKV